MSILAAVAGLSLVGAAHAQSAGPQIPTPANPFPEQPIATDGSKLSLGSSPWSAFHMDEVRTGRSVAHDSVDQAW